MDDILHLVAVRVECISGDLGISYELYSLNFDTVANRNKKVPAL
jgi:hypothetical protein